jgi:poly-gamma-glutamate synthesis protein (capsule biosynthesis protein)
MGIQQYNFEKTYEKTGETPYEVVMDFTGDFSLAEGVGTTSYYNSVEGDLTQCLSAPLLQELQCADVLVVNNEFVYSTGGVPVEGKDYHFRADPSTVSALLTMGCDVAGVANNHVYDYGEQGLLDTLSTLEDNGIPYIGAGQNLQEASEPVYFIINGRKIAFVAATQIERSTRYTKEATDSSPGVLKTLNPQKFVQAISLAKQNADYVICYVHWGTEDSVLYEEGQEELARSFIQAGADAIIGGHTHCLQGIDVIDGVPVFYSLGNFYFSQEAAMPEDYDTGVAQLILSADGSLEARFLPCYFSEGQLSLLEEGEQYQKILEQMRRLSGACTLDDRGYVITE